ncbi:MAG: hypothetical protein ACYC26_16520, partial [Phycisphaerales bacterium]
MKVDNTTLRQLSLGNDSARNSKSAQSAEPDAFGQLFASLTRTSQSAQGGAAEAAPSAHLSKGKAEEDTKVEGDQAGDTQVKKRDEGDADADTDTNVSGDATAQSSAGASAGSAAQERQAEMKAKLEDDAGGTGGKNAGEQVAVRIGEGKAGGADRGREIAKPQAAETTTAPEVAEAPQLQHVAQEDLKAADAKSQMQV